MACKLKEGLSEKIVELVHERGRITQAEIAQFADITLRTARRYLVMATAEGNLYRSPKHGTFPDRQSYEKWLIAQGKKRQKALEISEEPKFMMPYNPELNIRCKECINSPAMQRVLMNFNAGKTVIHTKGNQNG